MMRNAFSELKRSSAVSRHLSGVGAKRRGFTLIELLITTVIIGLLASIGTVSYTYVRVKARDTKRVADISTIRKAIETYFEQQSHYPDAPARGIVLGSPQAQVISDAGITPAGRERGLVYLQRVPANVEPNGLPYLYRGMARDGGPCTAECPDYEVIFELESGAGSLVAGAHALSSEGIEGPETGDADLDIPSFLATYVPDPGEAIAVFGDAAETAEAARERVAERPEVQTANKAVIAPVAVIAAIANIIAVAAAVAPLASFGQIVLILFSQPFQFLGRKRREGWGTVYDAGTKVPVDLATVRLIDAKTGRPAASKVTDKNGRYAFTPKAGTYRLEVVKPGYVFPAPSMQGRTSDGKYTDVYQGTLIRAEADGQQLAPDIPVEHEKAPAEQPRELLSERNREQIRRFLARSGPVLGVVAFVLTPSLIMGALLALHIVVYFFFKRLAEPERPKRHGIVFDQETKEPIPRAVVRILSMPYHKVLETKITDGKGRYSFHVGHGKYEIVVTKQGYGRTETDEIDFSHIKKPTYIASDLPMRRKTS